MRKDLSAERLNELTDTIIGAGVKIHRLLGPGLLENAYFVCMCHELTKAKLQVQTQVPLPLVYDGVQIDCAYRADLIVEDAVVVEIKALEAVAAVHVRQVHTYTKLAGCAVGLLLNFGAPLMRHGIRRVVNKFPESKPP